MKKISSLIITIILIMTCGGCSKDIQPNGNISYNHVSLSIDENDYASNVGFADYVFVGTVLEHVENIYAEGRASTILRIQVDYNIKGNLMETIEATRHIGFDENGTLILNETDSTQETELPAVNEKYIFIAYSQPDGSLILADIVGHYKYTDELFQDFQSYYEEQIEVERERFPSTYDID